MGGISDLEFVPMDCKTLLGFRAIVRILSAGNFYKGGTKVR